jgi:ketosteroid isomerase-like protein
MAEDYTYFDPSLDKRVDGRDAISQYLEPIRGKIHIDHDEILEPRVQTDGRTAVLTFNYTSYLNDETGAPKASSRWHTTEIYRRFDGAWKLISTHWSYTQDMLKEMAEAGAFKS